MQTLTRMDNVVTEDYYHMLKNDENVDSMKLPSIVNFLL